jgi:hypothetical protein
MSALVVDRVSPPQPPTPGSRRQRSLIVPRGGRSSTLKYRNECAQLQRRMQEPRHHLARASAPAHEHQMLEDRKGRRIVRREHARRVASSSGQHREKRNRLQLQHFRPLRACVPFLPSMKRSACARRPTTSRLALHVVPVVPCSQRRSVRSVSTLDPTTTPAACVSSVPSEARWRMRSTSSAASSGSSATSRSHARLCGAGWSRAWFARPGREGEDGHEHRAKVTEG